MKSIPATAAVLMLVLSTAPAAWAKPKLIQGAALTWQPTTSLGEKPAIDLTGTLKTKIQIGAVTDSRDQKELIGESREDADEGKILPVTTRDDVAEWLKARLADQLRQHGFNVVSEGGDVVIEGEVRRFMVTETNTYQADVGILLTLSDPGGQELWQGMANGSSERFGRSYKLENYLESISDAVLEAVYGTVSNPAFRDALKKR